MKPVWLAVMLGLALQSRSDECSGDVLDALTFKAETTWKQGILAPEFNSLAALGDAFEKALAECRASGVRRCGFQSAMIGQLTLDTIHAQASVVSLDALPLDGGRAYSKSHDITTQGDLQLEISIAAKALALATTLSSCLKAGNHFCEIINLTITHISDNKMEARADVRGFRLDFNRLKI